MCVCLQKMVTSKEEIEAQYNKLLSNIELLLQELHSRQEQQWVEEEEAQKMKELKVSEMVDEWWSVV